MYYWQAIGPFPVDNKQNIVGILFNKIRHCGYFLSEIDLFTGNEPRQNSYSGGNLVLPILDMIPKYTL